MIGYAPRVTNNASFFLWMGIFSLSVAAVYILNQLADIEVDSKNGGFPILAKRVVSIPEALIFVFILGCISVIIPIVYSFQTVGLLSILAIILGLLYSFKPTYFSGRPIFDFISNAIGYGIIAFGAGWHLAGGDLFTPAFLHSALPYFLLMCAGSISSTIPDMDGDWQCGKKTTAVTLGTSTANIIGLVLLCTTSVYSFLQNDYIALSCSLCALPFYIIYAFHPTRLWMEATYKIGGTCCILAAGLIQPMLFLFATMMFFSTWLYFRIRHNVMYPYLVMKTNE